MNIIRYYNQNKKSLWIICAVIVIIIMAVQMTVFVSNQSAEEERKQANKGKTPSVEEYKDNPDISVEIKDEEVKDEKSLIIDQFIRYCNSGKVQEAYNLLSTSCKNNVYPTLEKFTKNYYDSIYTGTKLYSKESYVLGTYKVKLYDDILSTGKTSGTNIEDYFTIVTENGETKLNISRFVKEEEPGIVAEGNNLKVEVKKKIVYKECTEYVLDIKNLTDKDIMLDSLNNPKSVYLTNGSVNYYAALNENTINDLTLYSNVVKQIRIKFQIEYNGTSNPDKMIFSNIVLDKNLYDSTEMKSSFDKIGKMEIKLK